jgi:hypothetical protein
MSAPQQTDSLKKKRMPEICRLQVVDVDNKLLLPPWLGCKRTMILHRPARCLAKRRVSLVRAVLHVRYGLCIQELGPKCNSPEVKSKIFHTSYGDLISFLK